MDSKQPSSAKPSHPKNTPRVLFVSKAVAPPFHDGSTCLVRDLSKALRGAHPTVLSTDEAPSIGPGIRTRPVYAKRSHFSPAKVDNLKVLLHLLRDTDHDIWHFVFAPNPASSYAGRIVKTIRKRPVVQTVASRPLRFETASRLLFGDRVIALSKYTADQLKKHGAKQSITVIRTPVADIARSEAQQRKAREEARIDKDAALVLYAGDLEFSSGADTIAEAAPAVLREASSAVIVFACRAKTPRAMQKRESLEARLESFGPRVRFLGEMRDLPSLIASASAVPFPVDDLYGKIDHPYVVLESALLRVPVLVPEGGPLEEIGGIPTMRNGDVKALAGWCVDMVRDDGARRQVGEVLREAVLREHDSSSVGEAVMDVYGELMGAV